MEIFIDSSSILGGIEELESISERAKSAVTVARQARLNGSFSGVSGLDQLGGGHGGVINGGPGSAISVVTSYSEQVGWLSDALSASYQALTGQNAFVARGMDIADEGGAVGEDGVSFPNRPSPRFENFSFMPPVVMPALSLDLLANAFSTTKIGESTAAAATWKQLSADVAGIATSLHAVAQDLGGSNSGEVIERAVAKVSEVARAGDTFAANASVMMGSVQRLAVIQQQGAVKVNLVRQGMGAIPDPAQRIAVEQTFLQTFPATFNPSVVTGIPPIQNLMTMDGGVNGGGEVALGMYEIEGDGKKHDATGLRPAKEALNAVSTLQHAAGAGSFGTVNQGVGQLGAVGDTGQIYADHVGTSAASTMTSGNSLSNISQSGGFGPGTPTAGGSPGFGGMVPGGLPGGAAGGLGAGGRAGGALGALGARGLANQGTTAASASGTSMPGQGQAFGPMGAGAMGRGGIPRGGIGSAAGAGGAVMTSSGAEATNMGSSGNTGAATRMGASPTGTSSGAGMRGGGPMMGAPMGGAGQQSKGSKVKTVTSAVEEDDNVAAILGNQPPVVPGVIGAWVRG